MNAAEPRHANAEHHEKKRIGLIAQQWTQQRNLFFPRKLFFFEKFGSAHCRVTHDKRSELAVSLNSGRRRQFG